MVQVIHPRGALAPTAGALCTKPIKTPPVDCMATAPLAGYSNMYGMPRKASHTQTSVCVMFWSSSLGAHIGCVMAWRATIDIPYGRHSFPHVKVHLQVKHARDSNQAMRHGCKQACSAAATSCQGTALLRCTCYHANRLFVCQVQWVRLWHCTARLKASTRRCCGYSA